MEVDYQYQVDYAKSNRSGCTKCKTNIPQDSLRIGRLIQSAHFDGKIPKWFHFRCFFTKNSKIKDSSEIKHFESLRWEDQEKIRKAILGSDASESTPQTSSLTIDARIKLSLPDVECSTCKTPLLNPRYTSACNQ